MDYEKKYKEAIEKARQLCSYPTTKPFISDLQDFFPELKKSRDERIRKALIHLVNSNKELSFGIDNYDGIKWSDIRAWLEKQAQKPAIEITPEESLGIDSETYNKIVDECIYGEQKPAAWSEEDKINLEKAIWYVENPATMVVKDSMLVEWLKSLKDRYTWKPSDEQLKSLQEVIDTGHFTSYPNALETLYEQLKKLMGE